MNLQKIQAKANLELENSGCSTAHLDVKVLLEHVLQEDEVFLFSHNLDVISNPQYQKFRRLIRRRKKGEPIAYIIGHKEFYGLDFKVNKNVLIPRPETEILVEKAIEFVELKVSQVYKVETKKHKQINQPTNPSHLLQVKMDHPISILDMGTGSGCIIISLARILLTTRYPLLASFFASDISPRALTVAKINAKKHEIYDNIRFYKSDLFGNKRLPKEFDLIIANLPYLARKRSVAYYSSPEHKGLKFEPEIALYSHNNGFALIEKMVTELPKRLAKNGIALLEIDESQTTKIYALCSQLKLNIKTVDNDSRYMGFVKISK